MITYKQIEVRLEGLKIDTVLLREKVSVLNTQIGFYKKSIIEYDSVVVPALVEKNEITVKFYDAENKRIKRQIWTTSAYTVIVGIIFGAVAL